MTAVPAFERRETVGGVAIATMIGLTFTWGLSNILTKIAIAGYNPVFVTLTRSALAAILVLGWCAFRGIPLFRRDGTLVPGLIVGGLFSIQFLLLFIGLEFTSVARAVLLANTMPFWVLIGAHFFLGEKMDGKKLAGIALAFVGVLVLFRDRLSVPGPDAWIGDLMNLAAGAVWAAITFVIKGTRLSDAVPEKVLCYQLGVSAAVSLCVLPFAGPVFRDPGMAANLAIVVQAVFVACISYIVWFWMVRRYPAASLSSFVFLVPSFGVFQGAIFLGEPLSPWVFLSLGLIAAGILIVNRPSRTVPAV